MPSVPGGLQGAQGTQGEAKSGQGQEPEPSEGRVRCRESTMGHPLVNMVKHKVNYDFK